MEETKVMGKVTPGMNDRIYRLATHLTKNASWERTPLPFTMTLKTKMLYL